MDDPAGAIPDRYSQNVYLGTPSLQTTEGPLSEPVRPVLWLTCKENTTSLYIVWHTFLHTDEVEVITRVDSLPARTDWWFVSTDFKAAGLWDGRSAIPFIRSLFGHNRLLAKVTPHGDNPQTAIFTISGVREAAAPLMAACGWDERTVFAPPAAPPRKAGMTPEELEASSDAYRKYLSRVMREAFPDSPQVRKAFPEK
jgi:hypothetical protein